MDLIEITDLVVPFSGENLSYPKNMRAIHLKNIAEVKKSNTVLPQNHKRLFPPKIFNTIWWNNLSNSWRVAISTSYSFEFLNNIQKTEERDKIIDIKFCSSPQDLSDLDKMSKFSFGQVDTIDIIKTLSPLFDFPNVKTLVLSPNLGQGFDLKRLLQFSTINELSIVNLAVKHFSALRNLPNLERLRIGTSNIETKELKIINEFPKLKSLFIAFSPYRTIRYLQGNKTIECLTITYTKGLKDLPKLKKLNLFSNEANPKIQNCPNIELIHVFSSKRLEDVLSFIHLDKLETLILRSNNKLIDLSLLYKIKSLKYFYVDDSTNLDSINDPLLNIESVYILDEKSKYFHLINSKFPNATIEKFIHPGYL